MPPREREDGLDHTQPQTNTRSIAYLSHLDEVEILLAGFDFKKDDRLIVK